MQHAVLWFGFSWNGSSAVELLFLCWLQRTVSESPPASRTWSPPCSEPKPQQYLAWTVGALILCPQPPTARCRLHGKLFWSVSEKGDLFIVAEDKLFLNTADQEDYQHWAHNKCKTCFILCIYPRVLQFCQTWKEIFNHNIIDIICQECILL